MTILTNAGGARVIYPVMQAVRDERDLLSELDGVIGDGDHGINMAKGMKLAEAHFADSPPVDLSAALVGLGRTLMSDVGGSMGPLYGSLFRGMGRAIANAPAVDRDTFGQMLSAGLEAVQGISQARVGDKTLMDVLEPAVSAYIARAAGDAPLDACIDAMIQAAEAGLESTRDLVARLGRSSRLGERSVGHLDAGAASCCLILTALGRGVLTAAAEDGDLS